MSLSLFTTSLLVVSAGYPKAAQLIVAASAVIRSHACFTSSSITSF